MTLEHGIITSVTYENGGVVCDVQPIRATNNYEGVPVLMPFTGMYAAPRPRQKVVLGQFDDGKRIILGIITRHSSDEYPDDLRTEELSFQVDENTVIELSRQGDGSHDVNITASGDVYIEGIPFADHAHDYSWSDSGGSGTTDAPE